MKKVTKMGLGILYRCAKSDRIGGLLVGDDSSIAPLRSSTLRIHFQHGSAHLSSICEREKLPIPSGLVVHQQLLHILLGFIQCTRL